jgi:hypothetical protein
VLPFPPATASPPPSPPRARVLPRIGGMVSLARLDEVKFSNLGSTSYDVECKARFTQKAHDFTCRVALHLDPSIRRRATSMFSTALPRGQPVPAVVLPVHGRGLPGAQAHRGRPRAQSLAQVRGQGMGIGDSSPRHRMPMRRAATPMYCHLPDNGVRVEAHSHRRCQLAAGCHLRLRCSYVTRPTPFVLCLFLYCSEMCHTILCAHPH